MTVQELIDELNKIEDKTQPVYIYQDGGCSGECWYIEPLDDNKGVELF